MTTSLFQLLPELSADEFAELREDIRRNGIRVPIDIDEDGEILDGHHRARIAEELGCECPTRVLSGLTGEQKRAHALAVNVHRRQLSQEQKRELIRASLRADPQLSDRQHAERTGSTHPTVAAMRAGMEASGDVEKLSTRTDSSGRHQPVSRGETPRVPPAERPGPAATDEEPRPAPVPDLEPGSELGPVTMPARQGFADALVAEIERQLPEALERNAEVQAQNALVADLRKDITPSREAQILAAVRPQLEFGRLSYVCQDFLIHLAGVDISMAARGFTPDKAPPIREAIERVTFLREALEAAA